MKHFFILMTFFFSGAAIADLNYEDKQKVSRVINNVVESVNSNDLESIAQNLTSDSSSELMIKIRKNLTGKSIRYRQDLSSWTQLSPDKVRVEGDFSAKGVGWSKQGPGIFFELEKHQGAWQISDTNFYKFELDLTILYFLIPLALAIFGFWLWMLIDMMMKEIPQNVKVVWLLLFMFFHIITAIVYFFKRNKYSCINNKVNV